MLSNMVPTDYKLITKKTNIKILRHLQNYRSKLNIIYANKQINKIPLIEESRDGRFYT